MVLLVVVVQVIKPNKTNALQRRAERNSAEPGQAAPIYARRRMFFAPLEAISAGASNAPDTQAAENP